MENNFEGLWEDAEKGMLADVMLGPNYEAYFKEFKKQYLHLSKEKLILKIFHVHIRCHIQNNQDIQTTNKMTSLIDEQTTYKAARKKGGEMKAKNNVAITTAKKEIYKLWLDWQKGKKIFASGANFVRFAINTYPAITSEKTIEEYLRNWKKGENIPK